MVSRQFILCKNLPAQWMLAAALFFSIFTFQGNSKNSGLFHREKVKIELVCATIIKHAKQTVLYKESVYAKNKSFFSYPSHKRILYSLLAFNRLEKIKFDRNLREINFSPIDNWFIQRKTIPRNFEAEICFSATG